MSKPGGGGTKLFIIIFLKLANASTGTPRTADVRATSRSTSASTNSLRTVNTTTCEASATCGCPHDSGTSWSFTAWSVTTTNFHGCNPNDDGVSTNACSNVCQSSAEI